MSKVFFTCAKYVFDKVSGLEVSAVEKCQEQEQWSNNNFPDLDSTAGSEWDEDGGSSHQHLSAISKEQLFQMLQKARARYHKYKGRYSDVAKAYQDLERENGKIKTVMQLINSISYFVTLH